MGIISRVKMVEDSKPPIITQAILTLVSAPSDMARAVGSIPTIMAVSAKNDRGDACKINLLLGYNKPREDA